MLSINEEKPFTITRDDSGVWILKGEEIEKLLKMTKFQEDESPDPLC